MLVRKIDVNSKKDINSFVNYPYSLYSESQYWVPPLLDSVKSNLNPLTHPFYKHSLAAFYIAEDPTSGEILGRLAMLNNKNFNHYKNSKTAFFCYFDCHDNQQVAESLFSAGISWAKAQGLSEIIGPRGFSAGEGGGILVSGFDQKPVMGVPYNYDYYDKLLTSVGFKKSTDYLSGYLGRDNTLSVRYRKIAFRLASKRGFKVKEFNNINDIDQWMERIIAAHQEAFAENHTYFPPTNDEILHLIKTLKTIADPNLVKIVLKEQKIVGFLVALPDLSSGLKRSKGRLWPFGWYHLLMEKRNTEIANVIMLAVDPSYRGKGVVALLYSALAGSFFKLNYQWLELVTVEEGNSKALAEYNNLGAYWHKKHRDYRLAV
jgi:ribosomal protein S18 acetylase RimI-like enzyme